MTIAEWRSSKDRVKIARRVLDDASFAEILKVLHDNSPLWMEKLGYGAAISDGDRNRFLGRIEGYQVCLANLKAMGEWTPATKEPRVSYAPPEE